MTGGAGTADTSAIVIGLSRKSFAVSDIYGQHNDGADFLVDAEARGVATRPPTIRFPSLAMLSGTASSNS